MWVPESISNGTQHHLERVPHILSYHVMTARVCGASRRSLVVADAWSPSSPRAVVCVHAVGTAAGRPPLANAAKERQRGAAQPSDQCRATQQPWRQQHSSSDATFAAHLIVGSHGIASDRTGPASLVVVVSVS